MTVVPFPHPPVPAGLADKRRTPRFPGRLPAVIVTLAGRVECEIVDASLTGARLRHDANTMIPRQCRLLVPSMDVDVLVQRRWQKGQTSGWRFVYGLDQVEMVEAAIAALAARLR